MCCCELCGQAWVVSLCSFFDLIPFHSFRVGPTHGSSVLHKGHRRALSGCLPMVGMGAVAWSSLRELEAPQPHPSFAPFRGLSPEGKDFGFYVHECFRVMTGAHMHYLSREKVMCVCVCMPVPVICISVFGARANFFLFSLCRIKATIS